MATELLPAVGAAVPEASSTSWQQRCCSSPLCVCHSSALLGPPPRSGSCPHLPFLLRRGACLLQQLTGMGTLVGMSPGFQKPDWIGLAKTANIDKTQSITGPKNWFPKFGRKIDNPSGFYKNRSIFTINRSVFPKTGSGPERTESTSAFFFFVEWLHQQLTKNREHEALKFKHLLFSPWQGGGGLGWSINRFSEDWLINFATQFWFFLNFYLSFYFTEFSWSVQSKFSWSVFTNISVEV
jgi:hypothetical protein